MLRASATSPRYPAIASSTRSSVGRPLLEASSFRRDSVSGLRCTSIRVSVKTGQESVKGIAKGGGQSLAQVHLHGILWLRLQSELRRRVRPIRTLTNMWDLDL